MPNFDSIILPAIPENPPTVDKNYLEGLPDGWYEDSSGPQYVYVWTDVEEGVTYVGVNSAWVIQK